MMLVVAGTGTGVGKTHVTRALALWLRGHGTRCAALKPVESGGDDDRNALEAASRFHVKPPPPYSFPRPVSPHLGAREQGITISPTTVARWVEVASAGAETTLVETAGGLFSPLSPTSTNADLLQSLSPDRWILVASDRLGTLHDVRCALLAAASCRLPPPVVVLSAPPRPDGSTGTNADELQTLGICPVAALFPWADPDDPTSQLAAEALGGALGLSARS